MLRGIRSRSLRLLPLLAVGALAGCLSPLHHAAENGDVAEIKRLIAEGANPDVVNEGLDRWTPMNSAIYHGRIESVQALLDAGADPEFNTAMGTPLQFAVAQHQPAIADLLRRAIDKKYGRVQPPPPQAVEPEPAPVPVEERPAPPAEKPWWEK
ncbi:MAG TPA: ankyrin repeat domain-containing protein [Elusimicrobiota bacterium]|jgi:hypothetical protein|nr:ankyrin repeat domain-containing protein [Elusimicrobiota bacterium]